MTHVHIFAMAGIMGTILTALIWLAQAALLKHFNS